MKIDIDWGKIITSAISMVVGAIVFGAATIVWKGATTVTDKVNQSKAELNHAIEGVADQLASVQTELTLLKTNFNIFKTDMTNYIDAKFVYGPPLPQELMDQFQLPKTIQEVTENDPSYMIQQKAIRSDILEQLQYKQ